MELSNPSPPAGSPPPPRLARIWLLQGGGSHGLEGCLLLSPSLAHNLGFRPSLAPILAPGKTPSGVGLERVEVVRAGRGREEGGGYRLLLRQPLGDPVAVPVARSAVVALVSSLARGRWEGKRWAVVQGEGDRAAGEREGKTSGKRLRG